MNDFDGPDPADSLPAAHRRELDRELAAHRRTNWLIALAVGLPVLAAVGLLSCLGFLLVQGPGHEAVGDQAAAEPQATESTGSKPLDRQARLEQQRAAAAAREEEEERKIRERIDRSVEARQRDAERRAARWLPPPPPDDKEEYEEK